MADKKRSVGKRNGNAERHSEKTAPEFQPKKPGKPGQGQYPSLNEEVCRQIVDAMRDALTVLDEDGTILFANNQAALNLSSGAPSCVVGKNISEFVPKEQAEREIERYRRVITTGQPLEQEIMVTLRGADRWFLDSLRPISFGSGNIPALVSNSRDITERMRSEENLLLLKHSIEVSTDGVFWIDRSGKFVYVNDAACRSIGYTNNELMQMSIGDVNPESTPAIWSAFWETFREQKNIRLESIHKRKDGSVFPVEIVSVFVQLGKQEFICGFARDITRRKQAAEALRLSEERLSLALQAAGQGIYDLDIRTGEAVVTPEYARMLGYDPAEFHETNEAWIERLHPDDREPVAALYRAYVKGEIPEYKVEFRQKTKDGNWKWILSLGKVIKRDAGGDPLRMIGTHTDITVLKRTEEALKESFELFVRFMQYLPGVAFIKDHKTRHLYVNNNFEKTFDVSKGGWQGKTNAELFPPSVAEALTRADQQVILNNESTQTEELIQDRHLLSCRFPIQSGEETFLGGIAIDITARKHAETALKKRERQLADSQRIGHIGGWEHDLVTDEVFCSDELYRILGIDPEKEQRDFTSFLAMVHPDDRPLLKKAIDETHRRQIPFSLDYRFILKDGRTRIIHAQGELIPDESGKPSILSGTAQDITELKLAEDKIRQSEGFIRSILDTVDEGFIVLDKDYRILTANKAYCRQVSLQCEEVIGRHCYEICHKRARLCYEAGEDCSVRHVFASGEPCTVVHRHIDDEGRVQFAELKAYAIRDQAGQVSSVIETVTNITERHLLEEERLKTQKLESIGKLAGGIAHDFNNLLQGIFGYITMAKMAIDEREKSVEMLEQAELALQQSVNLTTQLLTFSRGGKPVKKRLSLLPVIEGAARFALSGSRSEYRISSDPNLWRVEADEGQLGQVIQNIILNADQAMPTGGTVIVTAANMAKGDASLPPGLAKADYVVITIRDTGVGIPEQYLSKIFDPYFTTKEKGSGLGLATSYSIVRNHGGMIDVRTKSGEGSAFMIYLPAMAGEDRIAPAIGASMPSPQRPAKVLVMDDEKIIRNLSRDILGVLGHVVEVAINGEEALEKYQGAIEAGSPFDIVILDLTVRGGMGGEETLQKLLELDPAVKAIVSSGYSDNAAIANHLKLGFKAYLKKPYHIDELRNSIASLLS